MTLIILLCGLGLEYFVRALDKFRVFTWFSRYSQWLAAKCGKFKYLDGAVSVILILAGPLILVVFIQCALSHVHNLLPYLFGFFVLLYGMGPVFLNQVLDKYAKALDDGDKEQAAQCADQLCRSQSNPDPKKDEATIIGAIFVEANQRLYGVIWWFVMLGGPFGVLLFRLTNQLEADYRQTDGRVGDAVRCLYNILNWPSARLMALGNALSGNMVAALEAWREKEALSLTVNEDVAVAVGRAALQYPVTATDEGKESDTKSYWVRETQSLVNRTLIVWLAMIGLITIAQWGML